MVGLSAVQWKRTFVYSAALRSDGNNAGEDGGHDEDTILYCLYIEKMSTKYIVNLCSVFKTQDVMKANRKHMRTHFHY